MGERPEHPSEAARQRAITARLVVVIVVLCGLVGALLWRRYVG
jgi:hypothetical protein